MTTNTNSRYISVREAADQIAVSDQLIWKLVRQGRFPAHFVRLGSAIRIEKKSWEAFLASGEALSPSPQSQAQKRGRPPKPAPPINMDRQRELSA